MVPGDLLHRDIQRFLKIPIAGRSNDAKLVRGDSLAPLRQGYGTVS